MPEPLTIFAALGSIAQDLLKEKAKSAAQRLMSKSPVKKALDTTCSHFDTRFAGLRDALERWIDCEAFKGQLESLTTGLSAKTEEQHVEVFIRESGLQFGTADGARTAAVVGYFYSQIYIELCKGDDGLGVVGARLASVDQKIDDQDSKLDQILGRLPQARHFQLTGRQKLVQRSLIDKSVPVADLYESALRVWGDDSNAKRLMLAAHSIREMMASLPKVLELPVLAGQGRLGDQMNALEPVWVSAKNSNCHREGEWAGEIDGPLQNLLKGLHMFFEWWTESRPRRREVAAQLFRHSDPAGMPLPETLEKRRVERWLTLSENPGCVRTASAPWQRAVRSAADPDDKAAMDRARRAASLAAIGRAVYATLVETLREERDGLSTSDKHRSSLPEVIKQYRQEALDLEVRAVREDAPGLPGLFTQVLEQTQQWLSRSEDPKSLLPLYASMEQKRKGNRARLASTPIGRQRRAEWDNERHPLGEPLHYRWSNVKRMLLDLEEHD